VKNREQGKSESAENNIVRVFFALWPEDNVRAALYEQARQQHRQCGGRVMRAATLHMTVLFLGEMPAERMHELQRLATSVQVATFSLKLNVFAGWRHNAIGYAAPTEPPTALMTLSAQLRESLSHAGFGFDRKALKPHVTLLRKMENMPLLQAIDVPEWTVYEFVLVQSILGVQGVRYEIVGRWPLIREG
jgi:2'-5' RNA ligase